MVTLQKIDSSLFPELYEAFLIDDDPLSSEQDWRNVFDYQWETEEGYCGYAMLAEGEVVGMMGMVFCERLINGELRKFCNLHTWWVREDYRGRSLSMLRPVQKLSGYTITHFTPCDTIRAVTERMGFKPLCNQLKILPSIGRRRADQTEQLRVTFDESEIEEVLEEHEKKILLDHRPYGPGNMLIRDGDEYCYMLYTHVVRHRLPYCHIHYISNKELLARHEGFVRATLLKKHSPKFIAVDARLVEGLKFRFGFNFWAPAHAVFKSSDVNANQIDNLYSDVVFLKLTVLPDMSHELRQLAKRLSPSLSLSSKSLVRTM